MNLLAWVVLGLLVGFVAGRISRGAEYGLLGYVVIGVMGAIVGGFLASLPLAAEVTGFSPPTLLVAALGAAGLILLSRAIPGPQPFE